MYPVCAPDYQDDLIDLQTARLFDCSGMMGNWEYWCGATTTSFDPTQTVNLTSTYVIAMQAARHGAGICMSHDTLAADLVASGDLVRPFQGTAKLPEGYFLIAPASHDRQSSLPSSFRAWMEVPSV